MKKGQVMRWLLWVFVLCLSACTSVVIADRPDVEKGASWTILPFMNHTETPQAGLRAEYIVENILRAGGLHNLSRYPSTLVQEESLFENTERKQVDKALEWASKNGHKYAVLGTVEEWRYKVGVDGEPAVGLGIQVVDVATRKVIWAATGGKTGWSREALSAVAHKLIEELLDPVLIVIK